MNQGPVAEQVRDEETKVEEPEVDERLSERAE
jgi:hypothetical protein